MVETQSKWLLKRHADISAGVGKLETSVLKDASLIVKRDYYGTLAPQINIWNMDLKFEIAVTLPSQQRISADAAH